MKTIIFALFLLTSCLAFSQATEVSAKYDKIGKFENGVAIVQKNGLVGVIDMQGKEVVKVEYDRISNFGKDKIAITRKNDLVGLVNTDGKVIVDNMYDFIGHFKDGHAVVKKNGLCGVIDKKGKVVVEIKYKKIAIEEGGMVRATNADESVVLLKINN